MRFARVSYVPFLRARQVLAALRRLTRRGAQAAHPEPGRRRAILLQIDGLSSRRLRQALQRGDMPHLKRWLEDKKMVMRTVTAASPPSTPVFQAGLLYGHCGEVPGFGWYDRTLGRTVRMDLPEDVTAVERTLTRGAPGHPLLRSGVSYGTIWPGDAADAFFNVVRWLYGRSPTAHIVNNLYDHAASLLAGAAIAGRMASRFVLELGVGVNDFARWCLRIGSTRFEWRFLYMRLFVSVVMRDVAMQGAIVDVMRGVPIIYVDFLGYDEYAHRRGPDSEMALYNLAGIDHALGRIRRATRAVPEYGYDLYVFSDHGQSATTPFERVMGRDLHHFVLEHAAGCVGEPIESTAIRELVAVRETDFWIRTLWRPLRAPMQLYLWWLKHRLAQKLDGKSRRPLDGIQVVTGGSIAHLYFGRRRHGVRPLEDIERRWPKLVQALARCPAVGLMVGKGARGPIVYWRGKRYQLSNRAAVEPLEPARVLGYELLCRHLEDAVASRRSGDLVLYGAFAEGGTVAFDFEFGSHGGIAPDELDQFVIHPPEVTLPFGDEVRAEEFYAFFRSRYVRDDAEDARSSTAPASAA